MNVVNKNDVGDTGKGNTGVGIKVAGFGNVLDQNNVFANGGDGIDPASGSTAAFPNQDHQQRRRRPWQGQRRRRHHGRSGGGRRQRHPRQHDLRQHRQSGSAWPAPAPRFTATPSATRARATSPAASSAPVLQHQRLRNRGAPELRLRQHRTVRHEDHRQQQHDLQQQRRRQRQGQHRRRHQRGGNGNTINQNTVFANGKLVGTTYSGDGIDVSGGTAAKPERDHQQHRRRRRQGQLRQRHPGRGHRHRHDHPTEINGNTTRSNGLNGIRVTGTGHQLANNVSGGSGPIRAARTTAMRVLGRQRQLQRRRQHGQRHVSRVPSNSAFPTTCQGDTHSLNLAGGANGPARVSHSGRKGKGRVTPALFLCYENPRIRTT